ncbi:hypothetical protein D3C84_722710 [compost metagenome]
MGFQNTAGDIAEQTQPVKHLGHRFVAAQVRVTRGTRLGTFTFIGQRGNVRQQLGRVGVARFHRLRRACNAGEWTLAERWRRHIAQRLRYRQGRGDEGWQRFRFRRALAAEGEGLRDADRTHTQTPQQTAFGRADEQHAVDMGQALEHLEHLFLRGQIEIDQQVAAEHKIIGRLIDQQSRIEQVAHLQAYLIEHARAEPIAFVFGGEMPVAKGDVLSAKRVLAVQRAPGFLHRQRADIHAFDLELVRLEPGIQQCHGNRVRLLARGARQAENPQGAHVVDLGQASARQFRQGGEGFRVTEKPGLGDDHRFDQRLLLVA